MQIEPIQEIDSISDLPKTRICIRAENCKTNKGDTEYDEGRIYAIKERRHTR